MNAPSSAPALGTSGLDRAFRPGSVAILGASNDASRISGRTLHYLKQANYAGAIYPVNNRRETVQGLRAYASLASLPEAPDVALVALGADLVEEAVAECVARGVGAAVLYAAGFAETDAAGRERQDRVRALAQAGGLRLLGPNCLGLLHARSGFVGTFSSAFDEGVPRDGRVAVVSQSGAYAGHLAYLCRERGIGINYWISTGNEADIDLSACIAWLARQDDVGTIMAYAEGIRDGDRFIEALRLARENRKPVVFMKVGASSVGAVAAASHTASLAGADSVYDGVFRQYGVHRARTTEEHVDVVYACSRGVFPKSNKVGIVTVSGGFGIQLCDAAERTGLDVAPMPQAAQDSLKAINPFGSAGNPCDTTSGFLNDMTLITRTFRTMYEAGGYDALIGSFTVLPGSPTFGGRLRDAIAAGTEGFGDRPTLLCMAAPPEVVRAYDEAGFLIYPDSERAAVSLGALNRMREAFTQARPAPAVNPAMRRDFGTAVLSEADAQAVLGEAGLPFLPTRVVITGTQAAEAAATFGFPVAMKIVSPDILHKTEIGGVILNVADAVAAEAAFATLMGRAAARAPRAAIDGVLVTPMAPKGVETIIGVSRDVVFGPVVMFGLGGVLTELYKDVTFRVAPFDHAEAHSMMRDIKGFPLLTGYRGGPLAALDALAAALVRLSHFAAANADRLETIDLNPMLALPEGAVALDAVLVPRSPDGH